MADADPTSVLPLEPGERVLWEGRPGLGAPWHEVRKVLRTGFLVWTTGIALLFLVLEVLDRLATWFVITDARVAAVRLGGAPGVLWEQRLRPGESLRVERTWREPDGSLVIGCRSLRLRDDDPARVLETVRAAREGRA